LLDGYNETDCNWYGHRKKAARNSQGGWDSAQCFSASQKPGVAMMKGLQPQGLTIQMTTESALHTKPSTVDCLQKQKPR
jgi:hypothetical protein